MVPNNFSYENYFEKFEPNSLSLYIYIKRERELGYDIMHSMDRPHTIDRFFIPKKKVV
jgi:hypothetical protein